MVNGGTDSAISNSFLQFCNYYTSIHQIDEGMGIYQTQ
jgi:hypothetical protein